MCVFRERIPEFPWIPFHTEPEENGRAASVKAGLDRKYDRNSIRSTKFKSQVVCHDTNLLFAEAPEAYKNVEQVIASLQEFGLIEVAATLRPLITYKG